MTSTRFILASLKQYRRVHLAVAAGVAVATAVITGALLVGDSLRGSLRDLVTERLGRIDQVLVAEQPFRAALADELGGDETAPLLLVPGTLSVTDGGQSRRASKLSVIGHTEAFWQFAAAPPPVQLTGNQVGLSESIAAELQLSVGNEVLLNVPLLSNMPTESVLGEKANTTTARRLEVAAVLPDEGLARFSLRPSQQPPRNVFVPLEMLQKFMQLPQRANAVAIAGSVDKFEPSLEDYRISVSSIGADTSSAYLRITANRLVLPPAVVSACTTALPNTKIQPVITYLANTIRLGDRQIPYSTITGVDSLADIGPLLDDREQPLLLADDEIVLNDWAAEELAAKVGDSVTVTYYEPETTHGVLREGTPLTLRIRAVATMHDAQGGPTMASDPLLTPELPGVTDQRSISDWDLPFELVEPIRTVDEEYWDEFSTTPKAFVSYAVAKRLWRTRWGSDSVLRIPASAGIRTADIHQRLRPDPSKMGMTVLPVKQQGLAASQGTTPFEGLFLGFSFFLMASAVMLISLLFRLGMESRATELGVLATIGWTAAKLRSSWLGESAVVAVMGTALGVVAGIAYARLMIYGLSTWWVAATVTPFLQLHITPASLAIGFVAGLLVALATIAWSLRKLLKLPARQLLTGDCADEVVAAQSSGYRWLPPVFMATAIALASLSFGLEGEAQAGAFFGSGALVLSALLTALKHRLRSPSERELHSLSLANLATRNARRYPGRTLLSVSLAAVASFLIVALSAFRLAPTAQGTGGFELFATSDHPLHFDLNTSIGRDKLGIVGQANRQLGGTKVASFRVRAGEDASCLNLYQTAQPQVIGVPAGFDEQQRFGWSAYKEHETDSDTPWSLLAADLGVDEAGRPVVPVVLDKNTAVYSLHLSGVGARMTIDDAVERPVTLEVIGLLTNSVLQGMLLVSETNFVRLFPDAAGEQLFLIQQEAKTDRADRGPTAPDSTPRTGMAPATDITVDALSTDELATLLETQLEDYGFDAVSSVDKLAGFMAVQNTYLSTFQSLGALGLLLGTLGLAVAQLRSIIERRGELALLRSAGFRRSRLAQMVLGENTLLLLGGLAIGTLAALAAVLPHYILQEAATPWRTLLGLLATVLLAGVLAGWLAVRAALRSPLLSALRGD